jgi:aspartyl-tRNA(Asn)/glutamyl-tRNA(Gln) amidotransferase subunit A
LAELPATLTALRAAIGDGRISVTEALDAQFAKVGAIDADTHCVVAALQPQEAIPAGPLSGIALAHKDIFSLPGRTPGCGVHAGRTDAASQPAAVISLLQQAGAAQCATLVMAPLACGATGENANSATRVVNPVDTAASVGGSSSGSAVAVAAGLCSVSLGTDTAGSVRIPAATCGVLGLKTTAGLLSLEGVMPLAPSLDTVGLLAGSTQDAAAVLRVLAPQLFEHEQHEHERALRVSARLCAKQLDAEVADALTTFCTSAGVTPGDDAMGEIEGHAELTRLAETLLHVEASRLHRNGLQRQDLPDGATAVALPGLAIPDAWHTAAKAARAQHARDFAARFFGDSDILLIPALPEPVPDWDAVDTRSAGFQARRLLALHRFMSFVNYIGYPALVLPVARDGRGRPICVQALARPFHERALLRFAAHLSIREKPQTK